MKAVRADDSTAEIVVNVAAEPGKAANGVGDFDIDEVVVTPSNVFTTIWAYVPEVEGTFTVTGLVTATKTDDGKVYFLQFSTAFTRVGSTVAAVSSGDAILKDYMQDSGLNVYGMQSVSIGAAIALQVKGEEDVEYSWRIRAAVGLPRAEEE